MTTPAEDLFRLSRMTERQELVPPPRIVLVDDLAVLSGNLPASETPSDPTPKQELNHAVRMMARDIRHLEPLVKQRLTNAMGRIRRALTTYAAQFDDDWCE